MVGLQSPSLLLIGLLPVVCFQGRIYQVEYAEEAVKQGSATVGLKSETHAVLVALKVGLPYAYCILYQ